MAIVLEEPFGDACMTAIAAAVPDILMSAGTLVEVGIVTSRAGVAHLAERLIEAVQPEIAPVAAAFVARTTVNYGRWGRGFHASKLNMGDIYAYTLATDRDAPLLFIGDDFAQTDVRSVLPLPAA